VATATAYVNYSKADGNLLMWTWKDEPDIGSAPGQVAPSRMLALTQATHNNDPNHPVITNLAGYPFSNINDRRNGWHYPIVANSSELISDVYSADMYPYIYQSSGWTVAQWLAGIDKQQAYTYNLVPWFTFVEAGIQPCSNPPTCAGGAGPTPAQLTMEAWLAVIHGVKGISWWGSDLTYSDSAHLAAMAAFATRASQLTSVILGTSGRTVTSNCTTDHNRVDAAVRESGGYVYVLAARLTDVGEQSDPAINAQFNVSGVGSGSASVVGENRSVAVSGGVLADSFSTYGVHIYQIPAGNSQPAPPTGLAVVVK
jgi:hypothetical protein